MQYGSDWAAVPVDLAITYRKSPLSNEMRALAEILESHETLNYDYKLQLKKKQYVLMD